MQILINYFILACTLMMLITNNYINIKLNCSLMILPGPLALNSLSGPSAAPPQTTALQACAPHPLNRRGTRPAVLQHAAPYEPSANGAEGQTELKWPT